MHILKTEQRSIPYEIVYSHRKTLAIHIMPDKRVEVRSPKKIKPAQIKRFIEQRADWIEKHLKKSNSVTLYNLHKQIYTLDSPLWFKGKCYTIKEHSEQHLKFDKNIFTIKNSEIHRTILEFLRKQAILQFQETMALMLPIASRFDIQHNGQFTLKDLKAQWGSCSHQGDINLNMRLIHTPIDFIEYVVLHELCHIKHQNHSPDFHHLMTEMMPDQSIKRGLFKQMAFL